MSRFKLDDKSLFKALPLAALLALLFINTAFGAALRVRPLWAADQAPCRISFIREADDYILTRVPVSITNQFVSAVEAYSADNRLPGEVLFNDGVNLSVLIDVRGVEKRSRVDLYLVPGEKPAQPGAALMKEETPLHGIAGRTAGMDFPQTRAEADSLATRFDRIPKSFAVSGFDQLGGTFKEWYDGDWQRKSYLVDLNTWILVPADGMFIFGVAGVAPAWLDVDQKEVLAHPRHQPSDKWTVGKAFALKAGLHQVTVRTLCRQKIDTGVAWKREGEDGIAADVVMITGVELSAGRWEWSDRAVQPFFTMSAGKVYRFTGVDASFVPFTFVSRSVCWSGACHLIWNVAERAAGTSNRIEHTLASVNLPAKVVLTATAAESGESAEFSAAAAYDGPVWSEYEISSRMTGLQAACYGDDKVHPIIRVKTSAADGLKYTLNSEIEFVSGRKVNRADEMQTSQGWGRQYLAEVSAGSVRRIAWVLLHCGIELSSGQVLFQQDPYSIVPDGISGELFKKGDDFVVLVVSRRSAEREIAAAPAGPERRSVLFVDGFVADGAADPGVYCAGQSEFAWQWLSLSELERSSQRSGTAVLQSFTKVRDALEADVVIYAPSLRCIAQEGGAEGFERRLAAMCGVLTHAGKSAPRVILVVPPRYEPRASAGEGAPSAAVDSRQVAAIVVRVADVYGVETVDLFTAFEIAGNVAAAGSPLVKNGEMTEAGAELACSIIMRKL